MKLQISEQSVPTNDSVLATRDLYNCYGGMLLGYLTDVVKDRQLAEKYLTDIFAEMPGHIKEYFSLDRSIWVQLQSLAKSKLSSFFESRQDCRILEDEIHNKWIKTGNQLAQLNPVQRTVFCGMYYHNKTVATLSAELKQPEDVVKRILKEVFTIIRNGR